MKKILSLTMMAIAALTVNAQNIQLHYDFGRNIYPDEESARQKVTVTLEQFKADNWGSWYYFVDVDLSRKETLGAYTEISREINFIKKLPFAVHVEYNGGLGSRSGSYQQAALAGIAYNGNTPNYTATWSLQLLYISIQPTIACSSQVCGAFISSTARCRSLASSISGADRRPMVTASSSSSPSLSCGIMSLTTSV